MHLHVCEALDKVLGDTHRHELIEFDKFKVEEIHKYARTVEAQTAELDCIRALHHRLEFLMGIIDRQS